MLDRTLHMWTQMLELPACQMYQGSGSQDSLAMPA